MTDKILSLKVAARFAARPMKEEKLKALLLKLRKGAGTSIKGKELDQVFVYLGGWEIEETLIWEPQGGRFTRSNEPQRFARKEQSEVEQMWREAKDAEVTKLPDPESKPKYTTLYEDVSEIKEENGFFSFTFLSWRNVIGLRFKSPDHKTWEAVGNADTFLTSFVTLFGQTKDHPSLWKWLVEDTSFLTQINEKLNMPSYEQEKEQKRRERAPRVDGNMGTCPCCFGTFKLTPKTKEGKDKTMPGMVLHGYKRPGTGTIQGNCWGQDWPPFELSKEGTVAFLAALERTENEVEVLLRRYKSGDIDQLHVVEGNKMRVVKKDEPDFAKRLKDRVEEEEQRLSNLRLTVSIVKRNLADWKPQPLPEPGTPMRFPTL